MFEQVTEESTLMKLDYLGKVRPKTKLSSHKCGGDVFQTLFKSQPEWRMTLLIHYRHIGSSGADGIHHQWELVTYGQL